VIILDTHIWIWWVQDDPRLTARHRLLLKPLAIAYIYPFSYSLPYPLIGALRLASEFIFFSKKLLPSLTHPTGQETGFLKTILAAKPTSS